MSLPQQTEILIVGGGPAGLATALSLHKQGCTNLVIVDNLPPEAHTSRAMAIHAATLEALDDIGCADEIVAACTQVTKVRVWNDGAFHLVADFSTLQAHTKYPFAALLPQFVTERILEQKVVEKGILVLQPLKATGLSVNESDPEITDVTFEDGQVIQTRFVVGADGSKSTIRQAAGIAYTTPDGESLANTELNQAVVADVMFEHPPPVEQGDFMIIVSNENMFLCLPLPTAEYDGQEIWRITFGVPHGVPPRAPDTAYLQGVVDAYGPDVVPASSLPPTYQGPLKIVRTVWSSRFKTHSAISSTHFTRLKAADGREGGVVVLAGDAAHKHPPMGGQGMNLGIRDAVTLGATLAAHIKQNSPADASSQKARDDGLRRWADGRHTRALKVIRLTEFLFANVKLKDGITWYFGFIPVNKAMLRRWALWLGGVTGIMKRKAALQLSGLLDP